jgi:hypothetical protein
MNNELDDEMKVRQQRRWSYAWIISTLLILASAFFTFAAKNNFFYSRCGPVSPRNVCISNLKQIDAAKNTWALERKKPVGAVVRDSDLFGTNLYVHYLRDKPECISGGRYSLRPVGQKPRCSVYGHTI